MEVKLARGRLGVASMLAPLLLAACGSTASARASSPSSTAGHSSSKGRRAAGRLVVVLHAGKTAQVVAAAPSPGATTNEATFTVTALGRTGAPVTGAPVAFSVGKMVPLSGKPPTSWEVSGTPAAKAYIASASQTTNASGQATLTLLGQPSATMEMVGVKVGSLSTFSAKTGKAIGTLDAWWTSPTASKAPPIGDYVTLTPFAAAYPKGAAAGSLSISVMSPAGPVGAAGVSITRKAVSKGKGAGASGMGASSSGMGTPSPSLPKTAVLKTSGTGTASYALALGSRTTNSSGKAKAGKARLLSVLRVVVTQPDGVRVAGGMVAQLAEARTGPAPIG
ncbi:MAG: hypothetical protein ACYDH5_02780 [Acidimicrobiales bacterium]